MYRSVFAVGHTTSLVKNVMRTQRPRVMVLSSMRSFCVSTPTLQSSGESPKAPTDMTFEEYRKLKKSRQAQQRVFMVPTAFVSMVLCSYQVTEQFPQMFDPTVEIQPIMGMDPLFVCVLGSMAFSGVAAMLGSGAYGILWNVIRGQKAKSMAAWEDVYVDHVEKNRAPEQIRMSDDYYGDTVTTLKEYRKWLRAQRKNTKLIQSYPKPDDPIDRIVKE
eukprot:Clim_evm2s251 gene=Clim_evmTU2s251